MNCLACRRCPAFDAGVIAAVRPRYAIVSVGRNAIRTRFVDYRDIFSASVRAFSAPAKTDPRRSQRTESPSASRQFSHGQCMHRNNLAEIQRGNSLRIKSNAGSVSWSGDDELESERSSSGLQRDRGAAAQLHNRGSRKYVRTGSRIFMVHEDEVFSD